MNQNEKYISIIFYSTVSHGYYEVPAALVRAVEYPGNNISGFSGYDRYSDFLYLEEDCDGPNFLSFLKSNGYTLSFQEVLETPSEPLNIPKKNLDRYRHLL